MKRMPYKKFNQLIRRLHANGYKVRRSRERHFYPNFWTISRPSITSSWWHLTKPAIIFNATSQAHFIRIARYLLDGGPRPMLNRLWP